MFKTLRAERGFTLIELLIVIVIIGILAGIVIGLTGSSARKKANDAANKADIHELQNALEQYYSDNEAYVTTGNLANLATNYIAAVPTMKGGATLTYTSDGTTYTLNVSLLNQNDNGPNVTGNPKVYQVTNKQ